MSFQFSHYRSCLKLSQQRDIKAKKKGKTTASRGSSSQQFHYPCLKSIPFLYFSRDYLRWTVGDNLRPVIVCGPFWRSFTVWGSFAIGDHLWYCTVLVKHNHTNYKTNYQYQNQNLNLKISTTKAFS